MYEKVINAYNENFKQYTIPPLLAEMLTIDEFCEESGIAMGFMLCAENSDNIHSGLLPIPEEIQNQILDKLIFLAQADGTGSIYSIIRLNEDSPIEENPIVFFGSEGEILFAAADFNDWLRVISTGVEPMAFDKPIINNQQEVNDLVAKADIYIPKIIDFLGQLS